MCPAVLDTESPVQYHQQAAMEDTFFPPISRKSTMSMSTSEPDPSEYRTNKHERASHTRGSMPASLSASPVKFPTIDRANSTSVASLPGSRAARHRSQTRDLRSTLCRSPSCPSNLDANRDFTIDFAIFNRAVHTDRKLTEPSSSDNLKRDEKNKLPNIFSKEFGTKVEVSKKDFPRNLPHDVTNALALRRSESFKNTMNSVDKHQDTEPLSPRQNQTAALLLPIRTETKVNGRKKKKSRRSRVRDELDGDTFTPKAIGTLDESALEAIARENRQSDDEDLNTARTVEIDSSRKVKKWMSDNRTAQKGEIKA